MAPVINCGPVPVLVLAIPLVGQRPGTGRRNRAGKDLARPVGAAAVDGAIEKPPLMTGKVVLRRKEAAPPLGKLSKITVLEPLLLSVAVTEKVALAPIAAVASTGPVIVIAVVARGQ